MASSTLRLRIFAPIIIAACSVVCRHAPAQAIGDQKPTATDSPADLAARVEKLIQQLGDERFTVRQRAHEELAEIGAAAFDALTAAQSNRDLEIAQRARSLVQSIRMEWIRESDSADVRKILSDYDSLPDLERRKRIAQLSLKSQAEGLGPLCRIVRFERSVMLSKLAAVTIMDQKRPLPADWPQRSRIILDETVESKRPTVQWLRAYAQFPTKPQEALAEWKALLEEEQQQIKSQPTHEQRAIVAGLLRQQIIMFLEQKQQKEALVSMQLMLDTENSDSESLAQLIEWVIRQEAWELVDEVAQRLDRQLDGSPYLMYLVAQAYDLQGNSENAEKLAAKALAHPAGANNDHHFSMGYRLQQQGLMKWAEREYKEVIKSEKQGTFDELAYGMLGELLADQQRHSEAADVLENLIEKMRNRPRGRRGRSALERSADQVQARMHFFRGKQYAAEKNTEKQIEHLQQALKHDPTEADVLIALYRVERMEKEQRALVLEKIKRAASQFEQQLAAAPDNTTAMNQYAWLVGNTEGDTEKAIRLSQRSVELARPEQLGGYLDTLAHCYAAKKDYDAAVKHQARAVELEPHSGEIKRAFERFKRLRDSTSKAEASTKDGGEGAPEDAEAAAKEGTTLPSRP